MDPVTIGILAGLGKSFLVDQPKEQRQRELAANTALYSPWTGLTPDKVEEADPFGSGLQGMTAGMMYKQAGATSDLQQGQADLNKQMVGSQMDLNQARIDNMTPETIAPGAGGMSRAPAGQMGGMPGMNPMGGGAPGSGVYEMGQMPGGQSPYVDPLFGLQQQQLPYGPQNSGWGY